MDLPSLNSILESEREMDRELKKLEMAVATVNRANRVVKRVRYRLKEPFISQAVIKAKPAAQTKGFFKLPSELQHRIWKLLPTVADRLALALTCKETAIMFEATKSIKLADGKTFLFPKPQRTTKSHRLQVLVRLRSWVPAKYRLCYRCIQYINLEDDTNNGNWGGSTHIVDQGLMTEKAMRKGPRCALCVLADKLELASHKEAHKKFKQLARRYALA
ncbi:hypothetical protein HRR83_000653 [Exophiala dermatitidis]|uniref:Uncharacterized protein n=1 Tax=Exophiala dermatitidis TaxID=5970 RepID=A0AAN6F391_EXODE|nr:hypothetical protein HRR75_000596 [Exophiala dermatitidis]KAJ4527901.1 hypothetical protein HRR74_000656 [Exophiala dermatitidis]KAJ4528535.1 hypothetical protein HRR73_001158 [Exophiala dermatitidis]KAJ4529906.1 hypothetical protein HRR76_009154 [Exophiala dermatitidis]KAJ4552892.1 hypothetical protein HRR78_003151 [Exophiala dermatitidis]